MIALNFDVLGGNNYSLADTAFRHIDRRVDENGYPADAITLSNVRYLLIGFAETRRRDAIRSGRELRRALAYSENRADAMARVIAGSSNPHQPFTNDNRSAACTVKCVIASTLRFAFPRPLVII